MNTLIYGNESYLLNQKLAARIKALVGEQDGMNTVFYDASSPSFSMQALLEEAQTLPFFSEHKVLVLQNCAFLTRGTALKESDQKDLMNHLKQKVETCSIFFLHDNDNLDTHKNITKKIMEVCEVEYVKKLEPFAFRKELLELLKKNKIVMSDAAFEEFHKRMDSNLSVSHHEIEKLVLYGSRLDLSDVEALVSRPLDNETFHLVNALMGQDLKQALSIYRDMMTLNMEPLSFSGLIASQLRLLYQVACLQEAGYHRQEMINKLSGANNINVYRLNKLLDLANLTRPDRVLKVLNALAEFDQRAKNGLVDKKFGFELFLIEASQVWNH